MFETWHREQQHFCSEPGCGEKILYSPEFDRFGVMTLKESGKEDLYAFIQSHKDSVDLHKIMDRFNAGDTAALQKVQGMFGDFSQMPQTYAGGSPAGFWEAGGVTIPIASNQLSEPA